MLAPKRLPAFLALAFLSLSTAGSAQEAVRLAVDVEPGSPRSEPLDPRELVVFREAVYFVGESPLTGRELYRTDTTVEGTYVVADICPGRCSSDPDQLTVAGDHLFFRACDVARGCQLWSSDGTAAGTLALTGSPEIYPSGARRVRQIVAWNGQAVYVTSGGEVFLSDGTIAGTRFLSDVKPDYTISQTALAAGQSKLYVLLRQELWVSDGEGAERLLEAPETFFYGPPLAVGDQVFFAEAGEEPALWTSDGTAKGTRRVQRTAAVPSLRFGVGHRAYFVVSQHQDLTWRSTLYASDGTAAGTPAAPSSSTPGFFRAAFGSWRRPAS